jgi:hypothetical protein
MNRLCPFLSARKRKSTASDSRPSKKAKLDASLDGTSAELTQQVEAAKKDEEKAAGWCCPVFARGCLLTTVCVSSEVAKSFKLRRVALENKQAARLSRNRTRVLFVCLTMTVCCRQTDVLLPLPRLSCQRDQVGQVSLSKQGSSDGNEGSQFSVFWLLSFLSMLQTCELRQQWIPLLPEPGVDTRQSMCFACFCQKWKVSF